QDPCVAGANPGRREPEHDDGERPERKLPRQLAEAEHDTESDRRASSVPGTDEYPGREEEGGDGEQRVERLRVEHRAGLPKERTGRQKPGGSDDDEWTARRQESGERERQQ